MILTDGVHLISDISLEELHDFVRRMGFRRPWYHDHPVHPHYDLITRNTFSCALDLGARLVSSRELVRAYRSCLDSDSLRE